MDDTEDRATTETGEQPQREAPSDDVDDTPEFLTSEDAVEVNVDDEDVPMDDDDDEEAKEQDAETRDGAEDKPAVDMSKFKIETHTDAVFAVACHLQNDSELLVLSGGGDDKAFHHRLSGGSVSHRLPYDHTDSVSSVAFNMAFVGPDPHKTPRLAAVGGYDGAIVLYDPDSGEQKLKLEGPSDVEWMCFHPKGGSVLLVGSGDGTVWMFHIPLNRCLQVFVGHEQGVTAGAFTPDGKLALSASSDGTVRVWAPKTGVCKHTFRLGDAGLTCMATNGGSDGQLILVGAEDGQAHLCHTGTKRVVASLRHFEAPTGADVGEDEEMEYPMSVEGVGFCPSNPNWCATGGVDGVLKIWDLTKDGQCRQVCRSDAVTRLRWHPTLPVVFTSTSSAEIHLWDARNGTLIHTLTGHANVINDMDVQFLSNGAAVVASCGDDKTVRIFEVNVPEILQQQQQTNSAA